MAVIFETLSDQNLADLLKNGAVGVLPTDTLYGLVCRAADQAAVSRLYQIKRREQKPGTVIAASIEQLIELGIKPRYLKAVERFWPNALSVEIYHSLSYLNQNTGRQAFRVVKSPEELLNLLSKTGPLLTSSANQPGAQPANDIQDAISYFGDSVDFYVNGGDLSAREPSTLIRMVDDAVEVLRYGTVKIDEETGRIIA